MLGLVFSIFNFVIFIYKISKGKNRSVVYLHKLAFIWNDM